MTEYWLALAVLSLLCASAAVGFYAKPFVPEAHRLQIGLVEEPLSA